MTDAAARSREDFVAVGGRGLFTASFLGLLFTQFLTAVNDNIFRWLVIGIGKDYVDASRVGLILTSGTACFVVPYLVLAAPAGFLADRFSKRTVIVVCKLAEIVIVGLGVVAIWSEQLPLLFAVVALFGAHSALFSPSKMGIIPELLRAESISAANGLFGLTTVSATVIGMGVGNWLVDHTGFRGKESLWLSAVVMLGVATLGTVLSLLIRRVSSANPARHFPWNAAAGTLRDLRALASNRPLFRVALGIVFFWSVGAIAQLNIDQFAAEGGALNETAKVPLLFALVIGVGAGSVAAGVWSAGKVELGILPLGALGIALSSMTLCLVHGRVIDPAAQWTAGFVTACGLLFLLGGSAGLFSVPLEAYMQHRSPAASRGSILAASNFLTFLGILASACVYLGLRAPVYEGSLQNIPAELRGLPLSTESQQAVAALAARFARQWQQSPPADLDSALREAPSGAGAAALAELLWIDLQQRHRRGEFLNKDEYFARFPDNKPLVKAVYDQATNLPLFTSRQIFLLAGFCTIPVFVYIVWLIPQASIRFLVWLASRSVYRVRIFGRDNLPAEGGALLVCNHVSWLDGALLLLASSRPIRILVGADTIRARWLRRVADFWGAIVIGARPKEIVTALQTARAALKQGELVCIFPEGTMTQSGQLLGFRRGMVKLLEGTDVPVLPVYLDGLWGSLFSFERGRYFWKWPRRWPYPICIDFGQPFANPGEVHRVRRAVQELGAQAVTRRLRRTTELVPALLRSCRLRLARPKIADSTGAVLTGGQLLTRTLVVRRLLRRGILAKDEARVGVLLPTSAAGVVVNLALTLDRRVVVNLNYTLPPPALAACIAQAGIDRVLTSRRFLAKAGLTLDVPAVFVEDFFERATRLDKWSAAFQAYVVPRSVLVRSLGFHRVKGDDVLAIVFTAGSTGPPKGVLVTHANVGANVEALDQCLQITSRDVLLGGQPLFHPVGYTVALWAVVMGDARGAYHFDPRGGRAFGRLCRECGGTLLVSSPPLLGTCLERCEKGDFGSLNGVISGGEKLPTDLSDAFEQKFGVRPVEGYWAAELSSLVSLNIPPGRRLGESEPGRKEGTVGLPVPGVAAKVVRPDTGEELGAGEFGLLLVTGANVMKGYLGGEDLTARVMRDGWYVTGDTACIDEDGFLHIA